MYDVFIVVVSCACATAYAAASSCKTNHGDASLAARRRRCRV